MTIFIESDVTENSTLPHIAVVSKRELGSSLTFYYYGFIISNSRYSLIPRGEFLIKNST